MGNKHIALTKPCSRNELTVSLLPKPTSANLGLLGWYGRSRRDLPWRRTCEPYRIWISEIMLQQTQVKTVVGRYGAWFEQFPDVATLAAASEDAVFKAWEGLGYYRRARFIHQAAKNITSEHGGNFPHHFDEIMALPGIGRSTAGAIASFCFGMPAPVLDGNVKRVLKRWSGGCGSSERQLWSRAQQFIDEAHDPAGWNQAMMELGATICLPRRAECANCPVAADCASAFQPLEAVAAKRTKVSNLYWQVQLYSCPERGIWLRQRPEDGIWSGLWTPPIIELPAAPAAQPLYIHQLTHRRLHLYAVEPEEPPAGEGRWAESLHAYAVPTGIKRLLERAG